MTWPQAFVAVWLLIGVVGHLSSAVIVSCGGTLPPQRPQDRTAYGRWIAFAGKVLTAAVTAWILGQGGFWG